MLRANLERVRDQDVIIGDEVDGEDDFWGGVWRIEARPWLAAPL